MSSSDVMRYTTDDRDLPIEQQCDLVIFRGGNGDWYIQVAPVGKMATTGVRLSTSGGASTQVPGLTVAMSEAFRAMERVAKGERIQEPSRQELLEEVAAWRAAFPDHCYGILAIEPIPPSKDK